MKRLILKTLKNSRVPAGNGGNKQHLPSSLTTNTSCGSINTNTNSRRTFFDFSEDELKKLNKTNKPSETKDQNTTSNDNTSSTSTNTTATNQAAPSLDSQQIPPPWSASDESQQSKIAVPKKSVVTRNPTEILYGECLNHKAQNNLIEFSSERREDVNKMMNILSNVEGHNNIILVGENGVGRRSIVESLAYKIAKYPENVPERLRNSKIIELAVENLYGCNSTNNICSSFFTALKALKFYDALNFDLPPNPKLTSLQEKVSYLYGNNPPPTIHSEDVERLFNEMVESVNVYREQREHNVDQQPKILFIHQFYKMVDDYSYSFYDSISSVLHPLLERKKIKLVTCLTPSEYSKFTKNPLVSHFEVIKVNEPNFSTTLDIVTKKKDMLEASHGVFVNNEIVEEALQLSNRYIPLRANPMKCVSIIDELASIVERRSCSIPLPIIELQDKIKRTSINIDKKSDEDEDTTLLHKKLDSLKESYASKYSAWKSECSSLKTYRENRIRLIALKKELADCIASITNPQCESAKRASKIMEDEIPEIKANLKLYEKQSSKNKYVKNRATLDDLAGVISRMSGIPQQDLYFTSQKNHSLSNMETILESQIVGQSEAISSISKAIRVAKLGLRDPNKPQASLLFCGFSGVGKTELAKQIAKVVYGNENSFSVIDMTKYNTEWSVTGLIGVSPGYIGYDDGGELTNTLKKNPFQVIVFDEIEKAHHRVWNVLLPVFEEGVCQNNYGENVSLKDTIIVLTSNVGTKRLFQHRVEDHDLTQYEVFHEEIKETFSPEFLNRLDDIVIFNGLGMEDLDKILTIQLSKLEERLSKKRVIKIELSPEARKFLVFNSFDVQLGGRPIKRNIQKYVSVPISDLFYQGKLDKHCTLKVDVDGKQLKVEVQVDEKKEGLEKRKRNNDFDDLLDLEHSLKNAIQSSSSSSTTTTRTTTSTETINNE